MQTELSSTQIAQLTAILTGGGHKRSATKADAIKRFSSVASDAGLRNIETVLSAPYDKANQIVVNFKTGTKADKKLTTISAVAAAIESGDAEALQIVAEAAKVEPAPVVRQRERKAKVTTPRGKTKNEIMLDMVCAPGGATEAEICEAIGWKACLVTLRRAAASAGVVLRAEKPKGGKSRFFGTR